MIWKIVEPFRVEPAEEHEEGVGDGGGVSVPSLRSDCGDSNHLHQAPVDYLLNRGGLCQDNSKQAAPPFGRFLSRVR